MAVTFNPFTGSLDFTGSGADGVGDFWSDPVDANIVPDAEGNNRVIGSTSAYFSTIYTKTLNANSSINIQNSSKGSEGQILATATSPSGASLAFAMRNATSSDSFGFFSESSSSTGTASSGSIYIETGDRTAGTGNSGNIFIKPGSSSGGSQGYIYLNGAIKHATTSTTSGTLTRNYKYVQITNGGTFTLPAPTGLTSGINIALHKIDSNSTTATIATASGNIGGQSTVTLSELNEILFVYADGTNWQIVSHSFPTDTLQSEVWVYTSNGVGSTATRILQFATVGVNTGSAITRASTSANGDTFTINENGLYSIRFQYQNSGGNREFGITVNQTTLTQNITANPVGEVLASAAATSTNLRHECNVTAYLSTGDIIRANTDTNTGDSTTAGDCSFRIVKLRGMR